MTGNDRYDGYDAYLAFVQYFKSRVKENAKPLSYLSYLSYTCHKLLDLCLKVPGREAHNHHSKRQRQTITPLIFTNLSAGPSRLSPAVRLHRQIAAAGLCFNVSTSPRVHRGRFNHATPGSELWNVLHLPGCRACLKKRNKE